MSIWHYIGVVIVLAIITAVGLWSGRQVKSASDFTSGGRQVGTGVVAGAIIGTLVGGSSTIGTAQLAYHYGFSAWWFTLGGGIGCLLLAFVFAKPLYESDIRTLPEIFSREYGGQAAMTATLMTTAGSFLSIVSQVLSGIALVTAVSGIGGTWAAVIIVSLMFFYVIFGGVWGIGKVGIVKTIFLYTGIVACGCVALSCAGGLSAFPTLLPREQYFNMFARGVSTDLGGGLSLIVGVITSQAYIQALLCGKSLRVAKKGLLLSAMLIPLIGIFGIYVGMYMRVYYPNINAAMALPLFVLQAFPALPAGMILATLLVALVGTGAGVSLGVCTMFCNDVYKKYLNKTADEHRQLFINRTVIVVILVGAAMTTVGNLGSLIISWSFMSMGLRGAVAFVPLCTALFLPGRIPNHFALAAMVAGPLVTLTGKLALPANIDPLWPAIALTAAITMLGFLVGRWNKQPVR